MSSKHGMPIPTEYLNIYGPYTRMDGRMVVIYRLPNKTCRTVSYPKYLLHLNGVKFGPTDTVDHIDGNPENNQLSNLRVLPLALNASLGSPRVQQVEIVCAWCGIKAMKSARNLHGNAIKGRAGPFCGRRCAGKYSRMVHLGLCMPVDVAPEVPVEDRMYKQVQVPE